MKKLITLIALCAACYGANAQANVITIQNNTSCSINIIVRGGFSCSVTGFVSPTISIAGGGSVTYTPSTWSWPSGSTINAVDVFQSSMACALGSPPIRYSESCAGPTTVVSSFVVLNPTCGYCANITPTWVPSTPAPIRTASLTFN